MIKFLFKTEDLIVKIEKYLLILLVFLMVSLSFFQLVKRLFFNSGIIWMDIFLRYLVLNSALFSAALVTYYNKHFAMDAIFNFVNPKYHKAMRTLSNSFTILICALLFIASVKFVKYEIIYSSEAFMAKDISVKAFWFQLCMPISFLFMIFHLSLNYVRKPAEEKENSEGGI